MLRTLVLLMLFLTVKTAYALDLNELKQKYLPKIKDISQRVLPQNVVEKMFGKEEKQMPLPVLPKLEQDTTSTYSLPADSVLSTQGAAFRNLDIEQKRTYQVAFIEELYQATRRTKPTDEEILKWLNSLEQGAAREGIYSAMVLDSVYASLEDYVDPVSDQTVEFTQQFYKKYIGENVVADSIKKLNGYTIKKVVAEKSLEMMVALERNPEDLYKWYSVMSAELATKFPKVLNQSSIRNNSNATAHYQWSKSVPYQQIKSEVIIKIHLVYNAMMDEN